MSLKYSIGLRSSEGGKLASLKNYYQKILFGTVSSFYCNMKDIGNSVWKVTLNYPNWSNKLSFTFSIYRTRHQQCTYSHIGWHLYRRRNHPGWRGTISYRSSTRSSTSPSRVGTPCSYPSDQQLPCPVSHTHLQPPRTQRVLDPISMQTQGLQKENVKLNFNEKKGHFSD